MRVLYLLNPQNVDRLGGQGKPWQSNKVLQNTTKEKQDIPQHWYLCLNTGTCRKAEEWSVKKKGSKEWNKIHDTVWTQKRYRRYCLFFCFQPNIAFLPVFEQHTVPYCLSFTTCWFKRFLCFLEGERLWQLLPECFSTPHDGPNEWVDGWGRGKQGMKTYISLRTAIRASWLAWEMQQTGIEERRICSNNFFW